MSQGIRKRVNPVHAHPTQTAAMDHIQSNPQSEASPLLATTTSSSSPPQDGLQPIPPLASDDECHTIYNATTGIPASLYVLSGVTQPLLMTLIRDAGLSNSDCQLYMVFYYLGPASVGLKMFWSAHEPMPSYAMMARAGGITLFDIAAQSLNYTGAALAGPTIFAIVYSSVTVFTAVWSLVILRRTLLPGQWLGIVIVFAGLAITATDNSVQVGSSVAHGLVLVLIGSAMHGLTYVLCEVVMVVGEDAFSTMPRLLQTLVGDKNERRLTVVQNCAVQGFFAVVFMLVWQLIYTVPHYEELILDPMHQAGTSYSKAGWVLGSFGLANLVHALTYFFTLRHFPGGATSAGVMKGLQAVLVFLVTDFFFCGRTGGTEMCFSPTKFVSLVTVVGGVALFGVYTEQQHRLNTAKQLGSQAHPNSTV